MRKLQDKIITRESLEQKVSQWREHDRKVGFTSGSFDILHAGHVDYLEKAKEKCDILIAGINSDKSIRSYKGPKRPIISEELRVRALAGLESVDYVFIFNERRNRKNLEILKPTYYIKAGDYKIEQLTSKDVVEEYGGEVLILPIIQRISTTEIIEKILEFYRTERLEVETSEVKVEEKNSQKAVFLDRDGTINEEVEYLHEIEKFKLLPNVGEGMKKMQDMGYRIIIVTIQAGIGLGYFTKEDFYRVNREMFKQLKPYDISIDKIYFATSSKPANGKNPKVMLIERAVGEAELDLRQCFIIGDKTADLHAGEFFGIKKIRVQTGHGCGDREYNIVPNYIAADLFDAANWIEKQLK